LAVPAPDAAACGPRRRCENEADAPVEPDWKPCDGPERHLHRGGQARQDAGQVGRDAYLTW
jgi:hypothetical protein